MLHRPIVRAGSLSTSPGPAPFFFSDDQEWVAAGDASTRAYFPQSGSRRYEFGAVFKAEGNPDSVEFSLAYADRVATLHHAGDTWSALTDTGPIAVAEGELTGGAWMNVVIAANWVDGLWDSVVVNGSRTAPAVAIPPPPEPEWPNLAEVAAAFARGEDNSNLARDLSNNPAQVTATLSARKADWVRANPPKSVPAQLAHGEDAPFIRFSVAVNGGVDSAIVLERSWGLAL